MITIVFHPEFIDGELAVWAESPDLPGFSAAGDSVVEVRALVLEFLAAEEIEDDVLEQVFLADATGAACSIWLFGAGIEVEFPSPVQQMSIHRIDEPDAQLDLLNA